MRMFDAVLGRYARHDEAIVISSFFNPMQSAYRLTAFSAFYHSIRHLNHKIVECVIGDTPRQLEAYGIDAIHTDSLLWHKEAILNKIVAELPPQFKYVFWIDADVTFTNRHWLQQAIDKLKAGANIVQPWEYCFHLDRDETKPSFEVTNWIRSHASIPNSRNPHIWRGFAANYVASKQQAISDDYTVHGHVGFAWGARRDILQRVPLYDRALIGGADHLIAHAAAGHMMHPCVTRAFADNIAEVNEWSKRFYAVCQGKIGYVPGDLYHLWHGDTSRREYLRRIQEFAGKVQTIEEKDANGLYVDRNNQEYTQKYFASREVTSANAAAHRGTITPRIVSPPPSAARSSSGMGDDGFLLSMALGYATDSTLVGYLGGGNLAGAAVGSMLHPDDRRKQHDASPPPAPVDCNPQPVDDNREPIPPAAPDNPIPPGAALSSVQGEEQEFLRQLHNAHNVGDIHMAYADWLDEQGRTNEADSQRNWDQTYS